MFFKISSYKFDYKKHSGRMARNDVCGSYIQGVSTRKVTSVLKKLCGLEISSTQVSNAFKLLDEELEKWRNRPIGRIQYLQIDADMKKFAKTGWSYPVRFW